ncbi:MAG: hypothetical protein CR997_04860 [Acidobacteria bacterium]|nr:MAG: hypothetical protein CR997_04860 [Acidobacteriota bacterium]
MILKRNWFLFIFLTLILACHPKPDKENEKKKKTDKIPVEVTELQRGSIESVLKATTHLEAEEEVKVIARTSNMVKELLVEEGDRVQKDQPLLLIEDSQQKRNIRKAENDVVKMQMQFDRQQNLFKKNLISEKDFNEVKYSLMQKELALEDAKRELEFTVVKAPIGGTVTGRYIKTGDQVSAGQHLFDIIDFESLVARIYVPETNLVHLKEGQQARILTTALGERLFKGSIKRIAPVVDNKTGTVKVTVAVGSQQGLKPGMYVNLELILDKHLNALLIPKRALTYDADQIFVFKLKEDRKVERVLVVPVLSDNDNIEPSEGFHDGDTIVIAGQSGLKDGAIVRLPDDPQAKNEGQDD